VNTKIVVRKPCLHIAPHYTALQTSVKNDAVTAPQISLAC